MSLIYEGSYITICRRCYAETCLVGGEGGYSWVAETIIIKNIKKDTGSIA